MYLPKKQIQDTLAELVPIKQKELAALKKEHGNKVLRGIVVARANAMPRPAGRGWVGIYWWIEF